MISRPTAFGTALTFVGVGFTVWGLLSTTRLPWALVLGLVAVVAWMLRTALVFVSTGRLGGVARGAALCAVATGALAATATGADSLIPAVVCVMVLVADEALRIAAAAAVATGALALVAVGALLHEAPAPALGGMLVAILVGGFAGLSRRQTAQARRRDALLAERERALREEAGRNALARDLHDVLAHTLGGLVIQLDAAEALLEADDAPAAQSRVIAARQLAASGLGEARRAVAALRRSPESAPAPEESGADLDRALDELVAMHRALGGEITLERSGIGQPLSQAQAVALERAMQEALSNVRRHAPGSAVTATLAWRPDAVRLTVVNPIAGDGLAAGSGFGLRGMRERVEALPRGGRVDATHGGDRFVLVVEEVLA